MDSVVQFHTGSEGLSERWKHFKEDKSTVKKIACEDEFQNIDGGLWLIIKLFKIG